MSKAKQIIWESQHLEIDTKFNTLKYEEPEEDIPYDEYMPMMEPPSTTMSMTPFGMFKVDDAMHPFKQFTLWMGHTNFNLSNKVISTIQGIDGVELLRVLSRYRFIIGIGKAFNSLEVKQEIERQLCNEPSDENLTIIQNTDIRQKVNQMVSFLNQYQRWSLLIFPNGNCEFVVNTSQDFDRINLLHKKVKERTNGILIEK